MPPASPAFPAVRWGDLEVAFHASPLPPEVSATFAVVFALHADGFILADIPERGWITPSGRLEPGETPREAAVRETWEEIGGRLEDAREIGYYTLVSPGGEARYAAAFVGRVGEYGRIPEGSESRGARHATVEELPSLYWHWDELLEAMFEYACSFQL